MSDRIAELHAAFREGTLSEAEKAELLALLERGGPEAEEFLDLLRLDSLLTEELGPGTDPQAIWTKLRNVLVSSDGQGEVVWAAVRARIKPSRRLMAARKRRNWGLVLLPAAAASILIGFLTTMAILTREKPSAPGKAIATRPAQPAAGAPIAPRSLAQRRPSAPAEQAAPKTATPQRSPWELPPAPATSEEEELPVPMGPAVASQQVEEPPAPAPETAPGETKPWFAEAEPTEGSLWYSRSAGATWSESAGPVGLNPGDRVRTALARARIRYSSGTEIYLNRFATLSVRAPAPGTRSAPGALLVGGEIYIETSNSDKGFTVETPHGRAVALGTRFGVEAQPAGTTVVVVEGKVAASTDVGSVELAPEQKVRLPALGSAPDAVRRVPNAKQLFAWAKTPKERPPRPEGLQALYVFAEGRGNLVHDVSGAGEPIDLAISGSSYSWLLGGGLSFKGADHNTIASSRSTPKRLYDACTATNELTIEAWFRTASLAQYTARRIIDYESPLGEPVNDRNCSLCQEGANLNFRLRLSGYEDSTGFITDTNPLADTHTVYHAVCTYSPESGMKIYVNGKLCGRDPRSGKLAGAWRPDYILSIGNRTRSLDRDWEGDIYMAALYSRALSEEEVRRNFESGPPQLRTRR